MTSTAAPAAMKAIGLCAFGGPDVLQVVDVPVPEPGQGEVRIRTHAVNVNPTDISFRSGRRAAQLAESSPPYVPGVDVAGTVDKLGPGADGRLAVGDPVIAYVYAIGPRGGTYAQYVVVDQRSIVHAPASASFAEASTLLVNALTVDLALEEMDLPAAAPVAITGAAGGVGGFAVALATAADLVVIADAGPEDHELVEGFGATHVVERGPGWVGAVRELVPDGVPGLIDGADLAEDALPAVADDGAIATLKFWTGPGVRNIRVLPINSSTVATDTARLARLVDRVDDGTLKLRVAEVLPAAEAATAHRRLAAGGVRGRLVLDFDAPFPD
jgi:NADPH:quinone reductase